MLCYPISYIPSSSDSPGLAPNFLSSGLGASKDSFVGRSVGPSVEKNLKSLKEQNYVEIILD